MREPLTGLRDEMRAMRGKLLNDLRAIQRDRRRHFRWLVTTMVCGDLALFVALAHGFHWF